LKLLKLFVNCNKLKAVKIRLPSFCFLMLLLVFSKASPTPPPSIFKMQPTDKSDETVNVIYQNSTLYIKGIHVNGNLKIYSIIGNMIMEVNVKDFSKVVVPINLERQHLYIIRIETTDNRIFTHKIVAH
jgi:hypothetical protein